MKIGNYLFWTLPAAFPELPNGRVSHKVYAKKIPDWREIPDVRLQIFVVDFYLWQAQEAQKPLCPTDPRLNPTNGPDQEARVAPHRFLIWNGIPFLKMKLPPIARDLSRQD